MAGASIVLAVRRSHDPVRPQPAPSDPQHSRSLEEGPQFRSLTVLVVFTLLSGTVFYSTVEGWNVVDALCFEILSR
jgi:hypothetical protein